MIKGGPPKNPDDIFERARQAGAQEGPVPVQLQPQLLFYVMALTNGQLNMSLSPSISLHASDVTLSSTQHQGAEVVH